MNNQFEQDILVESPISLKEYFYLFRSWLWLIVLSGVLAGLAAYIVSARSTPIYETSTRLLVSDPPAMRSIEYTGITTTQTMARTYTEILVDRPVLQGVIDELKLKTTPEDLKKSILVELVRDTQVVVVTVQSASPQRAADIANSIASVFTERIRQLQSERYAATQEGLAQQVKDMEAQIDDTNKALGRETDTSKQLQLEARLTEYRRLYSNLVTNFEQVRLAEAQTSTTVVVSEPAAVPHVPVSPKTMRNTLLALFAGMLLAAGSVVGIDALDDSIKNPDDIRQKFNLPILGVIASHEGAVDMPVTQSEPRSPVSESFRALRTNIMYASVDRPIRRILVTSATPQDGKTTVSANLAVVLAQGEKKTVLLDADLRRPRVHKMFGVLNRLGLMNLFIRSSDAVLEVIHPMNVPGLSVITSGSLPPNPAELIASHKMTQILDWLTDTFDVVVIDTPPVLAVTDAVALSHSVDGVILVAKPGVTKLSAFRQTVERLQAVGAFLLGVVLNEVEPRSRKYGYYYDRYYSKYSHYYDQDGNKKNGSKSKRSVDKKVSA